MKRLVTYFTFAVIAFFGCVAQAQTFPTGPVTLISGFPPGGPADVVPRSITAKLSEFLGVPVIVENRPGANGNIAAAAVAKASPDGQTLLALSGGMVTVNQWLYKDLAFDPLTAFVPITNIAAAPNVLVVNGSVPAKNTQELIQLAKRKPGTLNYGTPGIGSSPHLSGEFFKISAGGIEIQHIPYKGGSHALKDLLGGRLQVGFSTPSLFRPHIESGKLRALAVTSRVRSPLLPDVPTMEEAGMSGFEVLGWYGLAAPKGTPKEVIQRIYTGVAAALKSQEVSDRLNRIGFTIVGDTPEDFARYVMAESEKWRRIIQQAGIKIE